MIKQNHKPSKEERLLRSALGKFAPIFNYLMKIEVDLKAAGQPGLADQTVKTLFGARDLEEAIKRALQQEGIKWPKP